MQDLFKIEELDVDGAIREAAETVDPGTRGAFLKKAGIGLGAVALGGGVMGALARPAFGATPASDVAILNFALTLEYLEAEFYTQAVASGVLRGELAEFSRVVKSHEVQHVNFLKSALGSAAVKKPKFDFKGTTSDSKKFATTAQVLESTGVAAYLGQVGNIKTKSILAAAGSILTVEARHTGWIAQINNGSGDNSPAPDTFDKPKTKAQILAAVKATGFIVG